MSRSCNHGLGDNGEAGGGPAIRKRIADTPGSLCEIRYKLLSDGRPSFCYQCTRCGNMIGGAMPKAEWPEHAPPWDDGLRERFWSEQESDPFSQINLYKAQRAAKDAAWWAGYNQYLLSPEWAYKRRKVIERESGVCQGCREAKGHHVHHLTYDRMGDELLTDLVLLCEPCHEKAHGRSFKRSA